MYAKHTNIFNPFEIFMWIVMGIVSIILLWRTFEDEDWPGPLVFVPLLNLVVLGIIVARVGWWALRHTLKEVILIAILTVVSLHFMPVIIESCPTLSGIIMLMPPSIIGGYLVSRKLGCHSYNLCIPAATITFTIIAISGIFILLMTLAGKSLGSERIHKILAEAIPVINDANADTALSTFNFGLYVIALIMIFSMPVFFVNGVIGAWIGEKIRLQLPHTPPNDDFMKIDNRVPPRPLVDRSTSDNCPLRPRARNSSQTPTTTEKQPVKTTILDKLKT